MPQYILQTKELCKEFAHTAAVNRVSMNIQQGDIYGFIGENGAGKNNFYAYGCRTCITHIWHNQVIWAGKLTGRAALYWVHD